MISRNEKNTHCAIVAWLTATLQMYVQTCIPSHDSRRVTRRHSRRGVLPPRERSYPSISPSVLKSILRIPPHLRSALRPKPGFDEGWESEEGIGKRWEKGENSISGVHIKVGRRLSTVTRANIGGGKVDELRSLLFVCMSTLTSNPIHLISSFFLHSSYVASGTSFISSLSFLTQRYMGRLDRTLSQRGRERSRKALVINNINVRVSSYPWHSREPRLNRIRTRYIFGYAPSDFFNLLRSRSDFCISLRNHQS